MSPNRIDKKKCNPQYIWNVNLDMDAVNIQLYLPNVLWVAFSIPECSLNI
jgi:hypothetical protein